MAKGIQKKQFLMLALLAIPLIILNSLSSHAADLDFGKSRLDTGYNLQDGGEKYPFDHKGKMDEKKVWLTPQGGCGGGQAIAYQLLPTQGMGPDNGMDQATNLLTPSRSDAIGFGQKAFFSFNIKVPSRYFGDVSSPEEGPIVWEFSQGAPYEPAIYARLYTRKSFDGAQLNFYVKNDLTGPYAGAKPIHIASIDFRKDKCQKISIMAIPRHASVAFSKYEKRGEVKVWAYDDKNQEDILAAKWFGYIGYHPDNPHGFHGNRQDQYKNRKPEKSFNSSIGLTRKRVTEKHTIIFDNVKVADTYKDLQ